MDQKLLKPEQICLQIIDMQKSLMAKILDAEKVIKTTQLLINCGRVLGIPIFGNTQYKKGLGPYVEELAPLVEDLPIFDKVEFGAAANAETIGYLKQLPASVNTVVLVGVETHICIYQTAMGLMEQGYQVWIVADGVSARAESDHLVGMRRLEKAGASIGSSEMLIYELLGKAGTPQFKQVLPHIIAKEG